MVQGAWRGGERGGRRRSPELPCQALQILRVDALRVELLLSFESRVDQTLDLDIL